MVQTPFSKRSQFNSGDLGNTTIADSLLRLMKNFGFSPLTGNWVIRLYTNIPKDVKASVFQSPYGDLGNTTLWTPLSSGIFRESFSPLTGIRVIRPCPSVPAP